MYHQKVQEDGILQFNIQLFVLSELFQDAGIIASIATFLPTRQRVTSEIYYST
jgi:hypothetical protein